ncbi:unnamed protein product, partial [Enterobius vermicularis]|uniref:ANK_REP_REGION domain-containing protein n=1 Tax=Enterobius vermicularis TaxID=51028 RepID=A0A0N4VJS7_ENTVE
MNCSQTVHYDETRNICHMADKSIQKVDESVVKEPLKLDMPVKYSDAAYSTYDIFTAASLGDELKKKSEPDRLNSSGWSALLYAAYMGHSAICSLLLDFGESVDASSIDGDTALIKAASCGNLSTIRLLIDRAATVDKQNLDGDTALSFAVIYSHNEVVKFLLESGADPNVRNKSGMTPTLLACSVGHELTLISVLEFGGNVYLKNEKGDDGEALAASNPKILEILKDPPQVMITVVNCYGNLLVLFMSSSELIHYIYIYI